MDKAPVRAQRFLAVTANPHATDAAHAILVRGGSAVDAAIAAQLVLGLVEPQSSGIGGGAFMLVHDARRSRLHAYDGREIAPAAASAGRFLKPDGTPLAFREAVATGIAVGVPGLVRMLGLAHAKHGRLAWAELFAPAIALAEGGFRVSPRLAMLIAADRQLNRAYDRALRAGVPASELAADQDQWMASREDAALRSPRALARLYDQRIAELNAWADEGR